MAHRVFRRASRGDRHDIGMLLAEGVLHFVDDRLEGRVGAVAPEDRERIEAEAEHAREAMQEDPAALEVDAAAIDEVTDAVRGDMAGAASLRVPLVVDTGVGANWDEAH